MVNIFTDEIKNTRFLLTIFLGILLIYFSIAIFTMAVLGVTISEFYQGSINLLLGAVVGQFITAIVSHFKNQEVAQAATIAADIKRENCP